ncbi:MAG: hypothetical protein QM529_07180 [Hydrotalea sp.]|nr:hypothetical protein [Hydrotalea sp.]
MSDNQNNNNHENNNEDGKGRKNTSLSIKKILSNELPNLLNKLLGEIDDLAMQPVAQVMAMDSDDMAQHQRLLKNLHEKHKTLKMILQNIALVLELNPSPNGREKTEITNLLARAETLIDKKILGPKAQGATTNDGDHGDE